MTPGHDPELAALFERTAAEPALVTFIDDCRAVLILFARGRRQQRRRRFALGLILAVCAAVLVDAHGRHGWRGSAALVVSLAVAFVYVAILKRLVGLGDRRGEGGAA